ncbi:MAG: hypothetical protein QXQ94_10370 [Candidatus Bathyarchaeia archaeon]
MESTLKVYSQSWRDPEKAYKERRFTIRQQLPTMPAHQLQNRINSLNEEIEILKTEIKECEEAIRQLKHGKKPENAYRKFNIHPSLTDITNNLIEKFKAEIKWRKQTAKWIRRERAIYLWEQRLRKTKALKLPILKHQQKTLSQRTLALLTQMKRHAEELQSLHEDYQKTVSQYHTIKQQINQLDFNGLTTYENERWVEKSISSDLFRKLNETFKCIPVDRCFSNLEGEG